MILGAVAVGGVVTADCRPGVMCLIPTISLVSGDMSTVSPFALPVSGDLIQDPSRPTNCGLRLPVREITKTFQALHFE